MRARVRTGAGTVAALALARPLAFVLALGATARVHAQPQPQPQPASDDYATTIGGALSSFEAGDFAEARALFRRAHELQPSARTLRGIGMTSFELRAYVDAIRALGAALTDARRPLEAPQRAQVQSLLDRAQAFVGRYRLEVSPLSATVTIDGQPLHREDDGNVLLDLGSHTLVGHADGHESATATVEVRGGEHDTLTLRLEPTRPASSTTTHATTVPTSLTAPPPTAGRDAGGGGSALTVWLTTAGVLAVGSVVTGVVWLRGRIDEVSQCNVPDMPGFACDNRSTLESERTTAALVTIGLGVGAIGALVVGLATRSYSPAEHDDDDARASLRCAPGALGVLCTGRF